MSPSATVVYVAYGIDRLDLSWIPSETPVIVVHNDERLRESACLHDLLTHLHPGANLGFGAGINRALALIDSDRVILCNPDTDLDEAHYVTLVDADGTTIVAVPLVEPDGAPNAVVNPYWSVPAFLATAWRLGRFVPRGGRLLRLLTPLLGRWGRGHRDALAQRGGEWSVRDRWVAGAVLSLPTEALRAVGGFDEDYFLYFEDADLHQRLARDFPALRIRLPDVEPARHAVGGCATTYEDRRAVARHRRASARVYASRQPGRPWRFAESVLAVGAP